MKIPCPKCDNMAVYDSHRQLFVCTRCHANFDIPMILSYYSTPEMEHELQQLEITNIENVEQLKQLKKTVKDNICRINTFQFLLKYDNSLHQTKQSTKKSTNKHKKYMEIGDAPFPVGLNNKKCVNPVAICTSKNCYLSYEDIHKKKCVMRECHALNWMDSKII